MFADDCRMKVGELGAIPRIVHALEASPDHRGVHFTGSSALSNFARTGMCVVCVWCVCGNVYIAETVLPPLPLQFSPTPLLPSPLPFFFLPPPSSLSPSLPSSLPSLLPPPLPFFLLLSPSPAFPLPPSPPSLLLLSPPFLFFSPFPISPPSPLSPHRTSPLSDGREQMCPSPHQSQLLLPLSPGHPSSFLQGTCPALQRW